MSNIQSFINAQFGEVRTLLVDEKVMFVANDVARALGYKRPADAITSHTKGSVNHRYLTNGGEQTVKLIPEGDIYRLAARSKLPGAEQFEAWIFDEVLPSIRKHGAYMTENTIHQALTNPDFLIQLATNLKHEQEQRKLAETKLVKQQPLVTFAETCMQSNQSIKVSEVAKLCNKQGLKIGRNRLYEKMREWGVIFKHSTEPTQKATEREYFEVVQGVKEKPNGEPFIWTTTYVTPKGQLYIINKLKKEMENYEF